MTTVLTEGRTLTEIRAALAARGIRMTRAALAYHCRDPRGQFYGHAFKQGDDRGEQWIVPSDLADRFAATWQPHGSLRK